MIPFLKHFYSSVPSIILKDETTVILFCFFFFIYIFIFGFILYLAAFCVCIFKSPHPFKKFFSLVEVKSTAKESRWNATQTREKVKLGRGKTKTAQWTIKLRCDYYFIFLRFIVFALCYLIFFLVSENNERRVRSKKVWLGSRTSDISLHRAFQSFRITFGPTNPFFTIGRLLG